MLYGLQLVVADGMNLRLLAFTVCLRRTNRYSAALALARVPYLTTAILYVRGISTAQAPSALSSFQAPSQFGTLCLVVTRMVDSASRQRHII